MACSCSLVSAIIWTRNAWAPASLTKVVKNQELLSYSSSSLDPPSFIILSYSSSVYSLFPSSSSSSLQVPLRCRSHHRHHWHVHLPSSVNSWHSRHCHVCRCDVWHHREAAHHLHWVDSLASIHSAHLLLHRELLRHLYLR